MNSRGFSLIELLATIIILAIIMLLAVPSVTSISNAIKKKNHENLIKRIEIMAAKYAFDTNETLIFVDDLIKNGYLSGDDNDNIIDPYNNKRLNCYLVKMTKERESYIAKFQDDFVYEDNGVCDSDLIATIEEEVFIEGMIDGEVISHSDNWLKGNLVSLRAYSNSINIDCEASICKWMSTGGNYLEGSEVILDNLEGILETKYSFQYIRQFDDDSQKRYSASINLKIDNEVPTITPSKFTYTDGEDGKQNVSIYATDGKGSGVTKYYVGASTTSCANVSSSSYQSSNNFMLNKNQTYLVCVQDAVGNTAEYMGLSIT